MTKKLVFYFYLNYENKDSDIYKFHLKCLEHYAHIFDEMLFVLSVDNIHTDLIHEWEEKLIKLHRKGTISFEVHLNNEFRETDAFKRHVVDNLGEEKLVFFGHGKGITNIENYPAEAIYKWIAGMYFYNLNFMKEVEDALINHKFMSYGSFLTQNKDEQTKYDWYYIGTFLWLNSGKIKNYIENNFVNLPSYCDRFYDEEFLANIYESWPAPYAYSHNKAYLRNATDYYHHFDEYLDLIYPEHGDFDNFYNEIKKSTDECL